jgi:hypothetical protein
MFVIRNQQKVETIINLYAKTECFHDWLKFDGVHGVKHCKPVTHVYNIYPNIVNHVNLTGLDSKCLSVGANRK